MYDSVLSSINRRLLLFTTLIATAVAFFIYTTPTHAATRTWSGAVSTSWGVNGNWVEGTAPTSVDDVVINGSYTNAPTLDLSGGATTTNSLSLGSSALSTLTFSNAATSTEKRLIVTNNVTIGALGTTTHTANTSSQAHIVYMDIGGDLTVDSGGKIDVTGRGYTYDAGPGTGGQVWTASAGGAGYGGRGGSAWSDAAGGAAYGSTTQPTDLGSGGASNVANGLYGGAGGGVIKLTVAGTATINGQVLATGRNGSGTTNGGGGGSGGSILLNAGTVTGSGGISARGGSSGSNSYGGGGSGGRVALYYTTNTFTGTTTAFGGSTGYRKGAAGTVFTKAASAIYGDLTIDNNSVQGATTTTLGSAAYDNLTVIRSALFTILSGHTFTLISTLTGSTTATTTISAGGILSASSLSSCSNSVIANFGTSTIASSFTIGSGCTWEESVATSTTFTNLTISSGGTLSHSANSSAQTYKLNASMTSLTVDSGGKVDVTGKGYTYDAGAGTGGQVWTSSSGGAGYGGNGGLAHSGATAGSAYGSTTQPTDLGSGGGSNIANGLYGGAGGGSIRLTVSGTATINGQVLSVGNNGLGTIGGGGGSGGSILLNVGTLAGSGGIRAAGGSSSNNSYGGAGSGGRIALYYTTNNFTGTTTAFGGSTGYQKGGAGTVFLKAASATYGNLTIDNNSVAGTTTTTGSSTYDNISIIRAGNLHIASGHTITLISTLTGSTTATTTIKTGGILSASSLNSCSNINIVNFGTSTIASSFSIGSGCTWEENVATSTTFTNLTINSGGVLSHSANASVQTYKLNTSMTSLTIDSGGKIDVTGKGYADQYGTGVGGMVWSSTSGGAGYGGAGGAGSSGATGGITYGSATEPIDNGSGGGSNYVGAIYGGAGGGAVKLIISGAAAINGQILATGRAGGGTSAGGGSGGSIWLRVGTLSGNGSMAANGGNGGASSGGGGGGRIALYYATKTFNGATTTTGGTGFASGSAGTVYLQVTNNTPTDPASLGPTEYVNGSYTTNTGPTLTFTQADSDGADTVRYQIQIDNTSDFSSPVVDYTSALAAQGSTSFTVGQAAGSGTYTTGAESQTLSAASYYWRVRTGDNSYATSSYSTANSGSIAFIVQTAPSTPTSLGPTAFVDGSATGDTQPTLTFTEADADVGDTIRYQIQIDDTSDFSSPVVDYTSALAAPGASTFTVGQAAGSGTYTTGAESQTLSTASYYWRVRSSDNHFATSSYATANSGAVAFIENTTPSAPTSLGPTALVNGSVTTDTTPTLTFTEADADAGDTTRYQIQIDASPSFSFPVIDYLSALDVPGTTSFTVGQAAGSGAYTNGFSGQTLPVGSFYWRVRSGDVHFSTSSYTTANSGGIAFEVRSSNTGSAGGGGVVVNSSPTAPSSEGFGYVKPRPQIAYPDGRVVYLDTPTSPPSSPQTPSTFPQTPPTLVVTSYLITGSRNAQVLNLQKHFNAIGFTVAKTGPGSPGQETSFFGAATRGAVIKFQKARGIEPTGTVGPITRKALQGK